MEKSRAYWKSSFYFIISAIGAAVGLGNIWKFPYVIGSNGGGYFLVAYIFSIFFCVLPILLAELAIGRYCKKNAFDSFALLSKRFKLSRSWIFMPILGLITATLILSFYSVVSGWSLYYLFISSAGELSEITSNSAAILWKNFASSPILLSACHTIFIILTMFFVAKGINKGLERLNIIAIPALFALLFILIFYVAFENYDNFIRALSFVFSFHEGSISLGKIMLSALGQAFFSLAVGVGAMIMYGSYLNDDAPLLKSGSMIAIAQLLVGLLASVAIFSVVFATGFEAGLETNENTSYPGKISSGPELMFVVIPSILSSMSYSGAVSFVFFLVLFIAALTSSVNIAELLVATFCEKFAISRNKSSIIVGIVVWFIGIILALSLNIYSDILIFDKNLFEFVINISSDYMLSIGGTLIAIYTGWILPKYLNMEEFINQNNYITKIWVFLLRFIAPIVPIIIMIM